MKNSITPQNDRKCPIYEKMIDGELCYETAMCMQGLFKLSSVPEAVDIKIQYDAARQICKDCRFSDMD